MQTDMTVGKPMKMLLNFTIPVFLGNVFQQLYSMADAVIVGKFVGTKGLAAVGATGTITFLIIGFLMGVTTGVTVLTSQKFGAGRMDEMRKTVGNAAILSAVIAVVMTAVSMLGMHRLLVFMHTPEDIFDGAYGYIMIICAGIFTQVLYNLLSSILRALGNSKTPLYFLILAAGLNTFFELFKKNQEFLPLFETCKGFCIPHFGDLVETAESALSDKEKKAFYAILFPMMEQNMQRLSDDLDWFCDKFDYRNKDADWRTSKDALPRGMQKAAGGYPADEPYTMDK